MISALWPLTAIVGAVPLFFLAAYVYFRALRSRLPDAPQLDDAIIRVGGSAKRLEALSRAAVDYIIIGSGESGFFCRSMRFVVGDFVRCGS
eukprot:scaffold1944_cov241-Pinguiococcus_pyrenoidosus.AAC.8